MIREYLHNTLDGPVSLAWPRHSAIKNFDAPRLSICVPVGPKMMADAMQDEQGNYFSGPAIRIPAAVPVQWLNAQMTLVHPLNWGCVYFTKWGMYSGQARQIMTMNALRNTQEDGYILYWDDDVLPPQMGLYTMANYMESHPEVGAISAVYCTREPVPEPVMYKEPTTGVCWDFAMGPEVEPTEVFSAGAGFLLVRVAAIRKAMTLLQPDEPLWADMKTTLVGNEPPDPVWGKGATWGHDIRFCRLIAQAGYKIMLDGRVECGHFDISTQVTYTLPDNSLPKMRGQKYRGEQYWDKVWSREGADKMRIHGDLFMSILANVQRHSKVVEIDCGNGVLGMLLAAQGGIEWKGYDPSEVAVNQACSKFLNAYQKSVFQLTPEDIKDADLIIASETANALILQDAAHLFKLVTGAGKKLMLVLPAEEADKVLAPIGYEAKVVKGDDKRALCILQPKGDDNETAQDRAGASDVREAGLRPQDSAELPQEHYSEAAGDCGGRLLAEPAAGRIPGLGSGGRR